MSRADNSFAFAFNKITPPENNSPEALRAYNSKVNQAFEEIYEKVYGYLSLKNLDAATRKTINNKVGSEDLHTLAEQTDEKFSWIVKSGESASTMELTDRLFELIAQDINLNGRVVIGGLSPALQTEVAKIATAINTANSASSTASSARSALINLCTDSGMTVIDGSNIYTGTMNTNDLYVRGIHSIGDNSIQVDMDVSDTHYAGMEVRKTSYTPRLRIGVTPALAEIDSPGADALVLARSGVTITLRVGTGAEFSSNAVPSSGAAGNATVGTASARWKQAFWTTAANVSSDLRLKKDRSPLNAADLLDKLKPLRYRLKSDPKKLHFGFGYQHVKKAVKGTDFEDAALLGDGGSNGLGLCYEELIAVLVEGHQKQQKRIANQDARIEALERRLAALEGSNDDRR